MNKLISQYNSLSPQACIVRSLIDTATPPRNYILRGLSTVYKVHTCSSWNSESLEEEKGICNYIHCSNLALSNTNSFLILEQTLELLPLVQVLIQIDGNVLRVNMESCPSALVWRKQTLYSRCIQTLLQLFEAGVSASIHTVKIVNDSNKTSSAPLI